MDHRTPIATLYRQRVDGFSATENRWAVRERWISQLRLATFIAAVALFIQGVNSGHGRPWYQAAGAALVGFYAAVVCHELIRRQALRSRILRQINEQAIARLERNWAALPETRVDVPPQHRATVADLDLFGHASLYHFLCSANTPVGIRVLRDWLVEPASPEEIARRQQAVAELAQHLDWRQTLNLEGRLLADRGKGTEAFVEWAEGSPWLAARPWLLWPIRILSAVPVLALVAIACQLVSAEHGGTAIVAVVFLNILLTGALGGKAQDIFALIHLRRGAVARYVRLFRLMAAMPHASDELDGVHREAMSLGGGVLRRMRQLNYIAMLTKIRHSALTALLLYIPLQFLFLYDFHLLTVFEAWQSKYGKHARAWFLALGKLEALASLATVAHDHPGWVMPEVSATADRLEARELGHPFLPDAARVGNDVQIGPAGTFLLVTGSNMSGKSTLLRAVGVNAVLAQAGAPVCARRLTMPPVLLATSMRIQDSLEDGVSFYMAELMRLKEIVDLARAAAPRQARVLYLLDEILLGTNSKERHLAVMRVLEHLLHRGTIGAISTHDLDLAASEPLAGACCCVHFSETLHDRDAQRPMTFDYKLRPGVATTTNALKLLEIVGLEARNPR